VSPTVAPATPRAPYAQASAIVPIREIGVRYRARIARHLLELDEHDRYLRFGYAASDEQIRRYVDGLNFERDQVFGIFNRRLRMIAMAHLAYPGDLARPALPNSASRSPGTRAAAATAACCSSAPPSTPSTTGWTRCTSTR
jgi:hypothetical protein